MSGIIYSWAANLSEDSHMLKIALSHRYDYQCSVLKGVAAIDYQHITNDGPIVTPENADPRIPFNATLPRMVCHNRDECGIGYTDHKGAPTYNWNSCPAHKTLGEGRSLLSTEQRETS